MNDVHGQTFCAPNPSIEGTPAGMSCEGFGIPPFIVDARACSASYVRGTNVTLTSDLAPTWGDACAAAVGATCTLLLDDTFVYVKAGY